MVAQEQDLNQQQSIAAQDVGADQRVQHEFRELNDLLAYIAETPVTGEPVSADPNWTIDDPEVTRWLITLEGRVNLDRIARFRRSLLSEENVADAQIISLDHGKIHIRVITNGGLPMGPLELAVGKLTARGVSTGPR